jgi:transposase
MCGPTDMRKAIDRLFNIVAYDLKKELCSEQVFVLCGRAHDKIKILQWSNNGFWLHYKQLEKGYFQCPNIDDVYLSLHISHQQLNLLLDGPSLHSLEANPHLTHRYHDE